MSFLTTKRTRPRAKNLLYRIGKKNGEFIYVAFSLLASAAVLASPFFGIAFKIIYFYPSRTGYFLIHPVMMLRGKYEDKKMLEKLCALNIAVNLGTSLVYILAYL